MELNDEIRNGYLVSSEAKRIWQIQIRLFEKLLEVCNKYGMRVWGGGGTMMGTVREHGYIPWDDDIDVILLRPDYDKLIEVAEKEFSHPFFFQSAYSDKDYVFGHSQLRMDGTSAILAGQVAAGYRYHMGVFIDIFPYDAVPDDQDEMDIQIQKRAELLNLMQRIVSGWDILHPFSSIWYCLKRNRLKEFYAEYEDLFRKHRIEDNKNVSCFMFQVDLEHYLQDKHWYDETIWLPFEDILMPIPKEFDKILSKQYGNYMTPRKEPTVHGGFWFLSADVPYEEFLREHKTEIRKMKRDRILSRIRRLLHK